MRIRQLTLWASALVFAATSVALAASVNAATLHVAKDGSGDYLTIQGALDVAAAGDTIRIAAGRYDDFHEHTFALGGTASVVAVPMLAPLIIQGDPSGGTIIGPATPTGESDGLLTVCFAPHDSFAEPIEVVDITMENAFVLAEPQSSARFVSCSFRGAVDHAVDLLDAENVHFVGCGFSGDDRADGIVSFVGGVNPGCKVVDCAFQNLNKAIGLVGSTGFEILNSNFIDVNVAIVIQYSSTGVVRGCSVQRASGGGLSVEENSIVELADCSFGAGSIGDLASATGSFVHGSDNVFHGGILSTIQVIGAGSRAQLSNCDIYNAGGHSVEVVVPTGTGGFVDLRNNYWGTDDAEQIRIWAKDCEDDFPFEVECLQFEPFLTQSVPATPISIGGVKARFAPGN